MFGAIIGDIVGSRFEFNNIKSKDFELFTDECRFTDDTVLTLAIAKTVLDVRNGRNPSTSELLSSLATKYMKAFGQKYINAGYGKRFTEWLMSDNAEPYESIGNGAAMRISPVGYAYYRSPELSNYSKAITDITHNTFDAVRGALAVCQSISMALQQKDKNEIYNFICENYYRLDKSLDEIRPSYTYDVTINGTVPVAIMAFLESDSFEDAIRNAISLGGDSDTIGAITGSIAGAYYPIPNEIKKKALSYLPGPLLGVCEEWDRFTF